MSIPTAVEIRLAEPGQMHLAKALFLEYAAELGVDLCFQNFEGELSSLPGLYAPPDGTILLAWSGSDCIGCAAVKRLSETRCEMKRLYVQPRFRESGAGKMLASGCLRFAKISYREMVLDTLKFLGPAIKLYASLGFEECAPYYGNPLPDVVYMRLSW